ncbi:MAG: ABC transporter substrate-binding protein/permease [Victivallaceae bacterium]|nr:ABC transporter substrate-binding protein/permease [Victivallaceae bacterium]
MRSGFILLISAAWGIIGCSPPAAGAGRELVTALTGKFPPFSYYDRQGKLAGFDVDVSREIARRLHRKSKLIATEWDGILAGLLAKKYDAIIGSMAITPERCKRVNFSIPYYNSGAQLFVRRDNPGRIYSLDECAGCRIAVVLGETYQRFLEKNYPDIKVVTFKSTVEIFEMLEQKRISGFVTDKLVGCWQIKQTKRPFVPVGGMLYTERIGIPVRKERVELLKQINRAVSAMRADGTMKKIYRRYFGTDVSSVRQSGEMTFAVKAGKLLKGFAVTLMIAFSSILIGFLLAVPAGVLLMHAGGIWLIPNLAVRWFVDVIRGTPVLIQLLFVWLGLGFRPFSAAIVTLGICAMAYMAEAVRSGLLSVDPGQNLAAKALGLPAVDRFRFVIWPQAFRVMLPPLMNSVVALIKDTALVSVISIPELIREAQSIISVTFEPRIYYLIAALLFFIVTFPLMKLSGKIERNIKARGFQYDQG